MRVCSMTRSKVTVTSPLKSENRPYSKAISSPIYNWGPANDHGFLHWGTIPKAYRGRIFIFVPHFVSRDFEVGSN